MGIGVAFFTEAVGAGPRKHMDIIGPGDERRRGAARAPDRQGAARRSACRPRARATRRRSRRSSPTSSGIPPEDVDVDPRRHRHDAVRPRHLRVALDAGQRRGHGARRPQGPRPRADRRRRRCSRSRPRTSSGSKGRWYRQGRPRAGRHDPGDRDGRARIGRAARGRRGRARRRDRLRPAEPDVPVRRLHLRRRRRPGHRQGQGPALRRGRRLRRADQPDDRRGPGPRRADRRRRHGADGARSPSTRRATASAGR